VRTQRSADRVLGMAAALLGVLVLVSARGIERQAGEGLTPRAIPVVIALALLASGGAVALAAWRHAEDRRTLDWPSRDGFRRMGVVLAATAVYVACLSVAGFPLASLLLVTGLTAYLGRGGWPSAAAAGVGTALVLYAVFIRLLGLALPSGPLS
jgi:putative tricarboxylic transport membrane protein